MEDEKEVLQWHPAFYAGLQVELGEEADKLEFESEHQLGTKPKAIDELVIMKRAGTVIKKNIGRIFRSYNIVEYKSPKDYLSVWSYYKVCAYAYFYMLEKPRKELGELTITYVTHGYPRKLMKRLRRVRKLEVVQKEPGIYYVLGEVICTQIIVTRKLDKKENLWLKGLTDKLEGDEAKALLDAYQKHHNETLYDSLMNIIIKANEGVFGGDHMRTTLEVMEGILADRIEEKKQQSRSEGLREGRSEGLREALKNVMKNLNFSVEEALQVLMIPEEEWGKFKELV